VNYVKKISNFLFMMIFCFLIFESRILVGAEETSPQGAVEADSDSDGSFEDSEGELCLQGLKLAVNSGNAKSVFDGLVAWAKKYYFSEDVFVLGEFITLIQSLLANDGNGLPEDCVDGWSVSKAIPCVSKLELFRFGLRHCILLDEVISDKEAKRRIEQLQGHCNIGMRSWSGFRFALISVALETKRVGVLDLFATEMRYHALPMLVQAIESEDFDCVEFIVSNLLRHHPQDFRSILEGIDYSSLMQQLYYSKKNDAALRIRMFINKTLEADDSNKEQKERQAATRQKELRKQFKSLCGFVDKQTDVGAIEGYLEFQLSGMKFKQAFELRDPKTGQTVLIWAVKQPPLWRYLFERLIPACTENSIDFTLRDTYGQTALSCVRNAMRHSHLPDGADELFKVSKKAVFLRSCQIIDQSRGVSHDEFTLLMDEFNRCVSDLGDGCFYVGITLFGGQLLCCAACFCNVDFVRYLCDCGADVLHSDDEPNKTALEVVKEVSGANIGNDVVLDLCRRVQRVLENQIEIELKLNDMFSDESTASVELHLYWVLKRLESLPTVIIGCNDSFAVYKRTSVPNTYIIFVTPKAEAMRTWAIRFSKLRELLEKDGYKQFVVISDQKEDGSGGVDLDS
jgi:hypothetical protein